jgi:hypothetical protein
VLTGILRLQWSQMMVGTLPVLVLIAPTVLAGAFQVLHCTRTLPWHPLIAPSQ